MLGAPVTYVGTPLPGEVPERLTYRESDVTHRNPSATSASSNS